MASLTSRIVNAIWEKLDDQMDDIVEKVIVRITDEAEDYMDDIVEKVIDKFIEKITNEWGEKHEWIKGSNKQRRIQ